MELYIANSSKQTSSLTFRLPDDANKVSERLYMQEIPSGEQRQILSGLTPKEVAFIVSHHARYGMVSEDEVKRTKVHIGLIYSIDKPVDIDRIMLADEGNADALTKMSEQVQADSAASLGATIVNENNNLASLEVEVTEDTKGGRKEGLHRGVEVVMREGREPKRKK